MSGSNKRTAQSPLSGDEEDLKRRYIMEDPPTLTSLEEIPEGEDSESASNEGSALSALLEEDDKSKPHSSRPPAEKVDCLIDRMDNFMKCFATLHSTVIKNDHSNQRKFKGLESAHNDLINKVVKSAETTEGRLEALEAKLEESLSANAKLADKVARLEDDNERKSRLQRHINVVNSDKITALEIEQGYTNRNMYDCRAEVKERKIIISGVAETSGENVKLTALNSINKVIEAALALKESDAHHGGLRKLKIREIDNVYRIGKLRKGHSKRNISVTFLTHDDKEMVTKAKAKLKDDEGLSYFFNDDVSNDGRALKTDLKRIAQVANTQGKSAKVSGNKVTIDSRSYFCNELHMIPSDVSDGLK